MTKIAVYTIALNEEKHVSRWFETAKEADLLLIADTGSTDKTRDLAKSFGIEVHEISVIPWRFDVARNTSLELIPEDFDICIQLDMDEVLSPGWRPKVEEAWKNGNQWPIYRYVFSRTSEGKPHHFQHYFKIHPRKGMYWLYPIHEIVRPKEGFSFKRELIDVEVDHLKDHSKSRSSYLELLELAVTEMPNDWRMGHYLNREYYYVQNWHRVLQTASDSLKITHGWDVERASTCMWASDAAERLGYPDWAMDWAERATQEAPEFYEAWHWRAHMAHLQNKWKECYEFAAKILILDKQHHHLVKPAVWEWWGYDLLALSAHKLGKHDRAVKYGRLALEGSPDNERLKSNLDFYLKALNSST